MMEACASRKAKVRSKKKHCAEKDLGDVPAPPDFTVDEILNDGSEQCKTEEDSDITHDCESRDKDINRVSDDSRTCSVQEDNEKSEEKMQNSLKIQKKATTTDKNEEENQPDEECGHVNKAEHSLCDQEAKNSKCDTVEPNETITGTGDVCLPKSQDDAYSNEGISNTLNEQYEASIKDTVNDKQLCNQNDEDVHSISKESNLNCVETSEQSGETTEHPAVTYQQLRTELMDLKDEQEATSSQVRNADDKELTCSTAEAESDSVVLKNELTFPVQELVSEETIQDHRKKIKRMYPQLKEALNEPLMRPFTEAQILMLYENSMIRQRDTVVSDFVETNAESHLSDSEFFKLIAAYLKSRQRVISSSKVLADLQVEFGDRSSQQWDILSDTVTASGKCADVKKVTVKHSFKYAVFVEQEATRVSHMLKELREILREKHSLYINNAEQARLKVEHYVYLVVSAEPFCSIPRNAPVSVNLNAPRYAQNLQTLKNCISVLFCFLRRPISDELFFNNLREWLTALVSLLLRVATLNDHLFLLNHVLRCPPGIHKWATNFIQVPSPLPWSRNTDFPIHFSCPQLDYIVVVLSTLFLPVEKRESFLQHLNAAVASSSEKDFEKLWVFVDSEGEEDEDPGNAWFHWQENDIVALLNQIPFGALFRHILYISVENDLLNYSISRTSEQELLKVISFSTHLINICHEGLKTFNLTRYRQLTKRIGRLIRHTVEYVSEHWENFRNANSARDEALLLRLQVEYDQFVLRAVNCIFFSESHGAWQFMAVLPYTCVSDVMLWQLLWLLHNSYQEAIEVNGLTAREIRNQLQDKTRKLLFQEKLNLMPQSEVFYLLTSFANIAASRENDGSSIIFTVTEEIFSISYLNKNLRETLSKEGRELLSSLAQKHPFVMSFLLDLVEEHMAHVGNMSYYLFSELPLKLWIPEKEDLDIISEFLLSHQLNSPENQLARLILQNLNYGLTDSENETILNLDTHKKVSLLLLEGYRKYYVPFDGSGFVYKQFKYLSDIATATKASTTPHGFVSWMWDILFRLKLHAFDRPGPLQLSLIIENELPEDITGLYDQDCLHPVVLGIKDFLPPAFYLAFTLSSVGYKRELVLQQGLKFLSTLVLKEQYTTAVQCIARIIPLFYHQSELLTDNKIFLTDLQYIITADLTYIAMAKNLIVNTFPGCILKQIAEMIRFHIHQALKWLPELGLLAVKLWLLLLLKLPDITVSKGALLSKAKGRECVMYLLDILVQIALTEANCISEVIEFFSENITSTVISASSSSVVASMFSYVLGNHSVTWPAVVPGPFPRVFPWFAWAGLLAESKVPTVANTWQNILKEMSLFPKLTVEAALKKVTSNLKVHQPPLEMLLIYRWSQHAIETDMEHPALPLIWQQFFSLYLQRPDISNMGSVGQKFFESFNNLSLLKKMKRRLNETADHFYKRLCETTQSLNACRDNEEQDEMVITQLETVHSLYNKLIKLFRTLCLWLEEPRLHDSGASLLSLPPQYNPEMLLKVLQGNNDHWFGLVDNRKMLKELTELLSSWQGKALPQQGELKVNRFETRLSAKERILKRLSGYEGPLPPPPVPLIKPVIADIPEEIFIHPQKMSSVISANLKVLSGQAHVFNSQITKLDNLDAVYIELIPKLYRNVNTDILLTAPCDLGSNCKNPFRTRVSFNEVRTNVTVMDESHQNRQEWITLLKSLIQPPSRTVTSSAVHIEVCITNLLRKYHDGSSEVKRMTKLLGSQLFFELLIALNQESSLHVPYRQFITTCIDVLGEEFIAGQDSQCLPLLETILKNPDLVGYVAAFFTPIMTQTEDYVKMYSLIVGFLSPPFYNALFVLLSKFDFSKWLAKMCSTPGQRRALIAVIEKALSKFGISPEADVLPLLELYQSHLTSLLMFQFPEHFVDILPVLVNGVEFCSVPVSVWHCFLHSLGFDLPTDRVTSKQLCSMMHAYSMNQKLLGCDLIKSIIKLLTDHFSKLRSKSETLRTGLYSRVHTYMYPLTAFCGLVIHCYIWETLKQEVPSSVVENLLSQIYSFYEPWLEVRQETHLPWLPSEIEDASLMYDTFVAAIHYNHKQTFESFSYNVLSHVWQQYVSLYAMKGTQEYILMMYQSLLKNLPWHCFIPVQQDLSLMCHLLGPKYSSHVPFLVSVFSQVAWPKILQHVIATESPHVVLEFHKCLSQLLIKLAWEPNLVQSKAFPRLLQSVEDFQWELLPLELVQDLLKVFTVSCNPMCCLEVHEKNPESTDTAVLKFLKHVTCVTPKTVSTPDALQKQRLYIKMVVELINKTVEQSPTILKSHTKDICKIIPNLFELCRMVIDVNQDTLFQRSVPLTSEVLSILSVATNAQLRDILLHSLIHFVQNHGDSTLLLPCLRSACSNIASVEHLVNIVENCILSYSCSGTDVLSADGGWSQLVPMILIPEITLSEFFSVCIAQHAHLTQYAYLLKKLPHCTCLEDEKSILVQLVDWLSQSCPTNEETEPKLLMLWEKVLTLSVRQLEYGGDTRAVYRLLESFTSTLSAMGEDKISVGLLGAIGFGRKSTVSIRFRFCCRVMCAFILSQMTESGSIYISSKRNEPYKPCVAASAAVSRLKGLQLNKAYQALSREVEEALIIVQDTSKSLTDGINVVRLLTNYFYSDKEYLKILFFGAL